LLDDAGVLDLLEYVDRSVLFTSKEESAASHPLQSAQDNIDRIMALSPDSLAVDSILLAFNQAALIQMQCGSADRARTLCHLALQMFFKQYKNTKEAAWIIGSVQPMINLCRLAVYSGSIGSSLDSLMALYRFAKYGSDCRVGRVVLNAPVYSIMKRSAPGTFTALVNAFVSESVRAHLLLNQRLPFRDHVDYLFAEQLDHCRAGLVVHEARVRVDLMGREWRGAIQNAEKLWSLTCERGDHNPAVLSLLVDALLGGHRCPEAESVLTMMGEYGEQHQREIPPSQQKRLFFMMGYRYINCNRMSDAVRCMERAQSYASEQSDQRMLFRIAMMRYVLALRFRECRGMYGGAVRELRSVASKSYYAREKTMAQFIIQSQYFSQEQWEQMWFLSATTQYDSVLQRRINCDVSGREEVLPGLRKSPRTIAAEELLRGNPVGDIFDLLVHMASQVDLPGTAN
jgi:hypothetical protein